MLIIYAIVTEQSVGHMFIAGIIPGILLSIAYGILILFLAYLTPRFVGGQEAADVAAEDWANLTWVDLVKKIVPVCVLVIVVLGGIYGGVFTPTEAGAAGSLAALVIAILRRGFTWRDLWEVLVETGYITAAILFLIITASMYSRMLGVAALPTVFGNWISTFDLTLNELMIVYVLLMVLLGTIIETAVDHPDRGAAIPGRARQFRRQSGVVRHRHRGRRRDRPADAAAGHLLLRHQERDQRSHRLAGGYLLGRVSVCRNHAAGPDNSGLVPASQLGATLTTR